MVAAVKSQPDPEPDREPKGVDILTAGEIAEAEKAAAQSFLTLGNEAYPQIGLQGALAWVRYKRTDPRMTYAKYMSSHTLEEIYREIGLIEDEDDDDEGKGDGSTSTS